MVDLVRIRPGITVAAPHADRFHGLLTDLEAAGYGVQSNQSGGYNPRNIAGTNRPSQHAFGNAVDVNWNDNARGTQGNIPADLARSLAQKHGLTWGGDWKNPDPMHFEVAGGQAVPHVHGTAPEQPVQAAQLGAQPMADQQQPKGLLDGIAERATSPLFLAGLGAFASASQGNDWTKGMMEGAQTGGALGQSAMQQVKMRRELERQKAADDLIKNLPNNPALATLPAEVRAGIGALPPDQAAQALATVLTHRGDVTQQGALERQKAAIELQKSIELAKAQRQINMDMWDQLRNKMQAKNGAQSAAPRVATPEELNALPSGASFIAPDGSLRRKN